MKRVFLCLLMAGLGPANWCWGQAPEAMSTEEAAIRKTVEMYVAAFNAQDAKGLAAQWSPEAVYTNRLTGEQVVGREAIAEQFAALFQAQPSVKLKVSVESIQFLSPNVAVEHGTATLLAPDGEPEEVDYTAIHVKREGQWLLDRVTDEPGEGADSPYKQLKQLEWMVGRWVDQDQEAVVETVCDWTANRSFLKRSFSIAVGDQVHLSGVQIIGWDGAEGKIRSWTFDSEGGFAEATWARKGDRWFVHNKGVLADGRRASAVNVIKPVDENSFTWQTIERTAGGEVLPNVDEVLIVRQ